MNAVGNLNGGGRRVYRSIFLDDSWAHQKYFNWGVVEDRTGLRVLRKRQSGFTRSLILLTKGGETALEESVRQSCGRIGAADVIIHDFDCLLPESPVVAGRSFRSTDQSERMLNIATYVVDLEEREEVLWNKFGAKSRNAVRKAESNGARFIQDADFKKTVNSFYEFYEPVARRNALSTPSYELLERMHRGGNLLCVACEESGGKITAVNLIYSAGRSSLFMYGANDPAAGTGSGQFIQWNTILMLQKFGCEWYDLGGVQVQAEMDGIHRFKKSIGGAFQNLGVEFRHETLSFALARAGLNNLRKRYVYS